MLCKFVIFLVQSISEEQVLLKAFCSDSCSCNYVYLHYKLQQEYFSLRGALDSATLPPSNRNQAFRTQAKLMCVRSLC